jgi:hypothetical protein
MFLKQLVGATAVAAIIGGGLLFTATAASAETAPTQTEVLSCLNQVSSATEPALSAEWNLGASSVNKSSVLADISQARTLVNSVSCVASLQPDSTVTAQVTKEYDSATASVNKGQFATAAATLHQAYIDYSAVEDKLLDVLYG